MLGTIVKILIGLSFLVKAMDSKQSGNTGEAIYYMTWAVLTAVVFNA